jgi:hypothetical protein
LASYRSLGITEIASAVTVLRRRTAPSNWTEAFALAAGPIDDAGARIEGVLAGIDHFRTRRPEHLVSDRLALVEGHDLRQRLWCADGSYRPQVVQLQAPGFPLVGALSPEGLPVLFALDSSRDLGAVIAAVADDYGLPEHDLRDRLLPQLHELGLRGFLRPASSPGAPRE